MLIISKFRDYYDSLARSLGVDKAFIFRHTATETPLLKPILPHFSTHGKESTHLAGVIFCGKLIPYLHTSTISGTFESIPDTDEFDIAKIEAVLTAERQFLNHLVGELRAAMVRDYSDLCILHNTPTLMTSSVSRTLHINPRLADVGFQRIRPPAQAFQQISQFVSGVLTQPERTASTQTSREKVAAHGFDRFSFRKDTPPTRKQSRPPR